ncbi:MAG TPA: hypothetical protein VGP26_04025 [Actinophytocola sp.]|nr:hypothetical protein [Actinophytocola sp.]
MIHAFTADRIRPAPDLPVVAGAPAVRERRWPGQSRQADTGRHHVDESSWLDVAERVLHSWPITLRLAILMVVLATGTAVVAAVVGVACQLALAGLGIRARVRRRRRVRALQLRRAMLERPGAARRGAG